MTSNYTKFKAFCYASCRSKYGCPDDSDVRDDKCVWNETSNPHYRQPYEYYSFFIEGVNHFNKSTFIQKFHHYAHGMLLSYFV